MRFTECSSVIQFGARKETHWWKHSTGKKKKQAVKHHWTRFVLKPCLLKLKKCSSSYDMNISLLFLYSKVSGALFVSCATSRDSHAVHAACCLFWTCFLRFFILTENPNTAHTSTVWKETKPVVFNFFLSKFLSVLSLNISIDKYSFFLCHLKSVFSVMIGSDQKILYSCFFPGGS